MAEAAGVEVKRRGRAWGVLRVVPAVVLGALLAVCWGLMYSGGLAGVAAWALVLSVVPVLGLVVLLALGIYAAVRRRVGPLMGVTAALALVALWPGAWSFGVLQIAYPASLEGMEPAATVRLPSDEALRVAWGGDDLSTNYHAFTPDQRWAYDLVVEPFFTGSTELEGYGCWGTPVVAPAAARVHAAHDGEEDQRPGVEAGFDKPLGNHVVLELETGTYLILAHLQRGSLAVEAGQRVEEGQVLGRCGNSGHTSEPHIHIHHQRQDPLRFPVLFAEGLPLYFRDHDGAAMPKGGIALEGERVEARGEVVRHVGAKARP